MLSVCPSSSSLGLPLLLTSSQSARQLFQILLRDSRSLSLSSPPSPSPTLSFHPTLPLSSTSFQIICATLLPAGNMDGVSQSPPGGPTMGPKDRTSGLPVPAGPAPCSLPKAAHPQVLADHPDPGLLLFGGPREEENFLHEGFLARLGPQGTLS